MSQLQFIYELTFKGNNDYILIEIKKKKIPDNGVYHPL